MSGKRKARRQDPDARGRRLPFWKKALVGLSLGLMVLGLGLQGLGSLRSAGEPAAETAQAPEAPPRGDEFGRGFLPSDEGPLGRWPSPQGPQTGPEEQAGPSADGTQGAPRSWEPLLFRLGFSFFVGFCMGCALRAFFRISLVAIGVILLAVFGLQYAGLVEVDWAAMQGPYEGVVAWLREQSADFGRFVSGQVPAAALATLGLVVGFKK